jgi:hypothetical protein
LVKVGKSVLEFVVADPEVMVANNLLKNIYKSEEDPKLLKIISCNKKYASDIKDCVSKMSDSLKETIEHLVKHEDRLLMKAKLGVWKSKAEVKRVPDTSKIATKSGLWKRLVATPTGLTSSASTPHALVESPQEKTKLRPNFIHLDVKLFMEEKLEDVPQVETKVDVVTVDTAKVEEEPPKVTREAGLED